MRILASAIVDTVNGFLHAGYISAYPRPFEPEMTMAKDSVPTHLIDVETALRLKDAASASLHSASQQVATAGLGDLLSPSGILAGVAAVAGGAAFVLLSRRLGIQSRVLAASLGGVLVLGATAQSCDKPLPDEPPWEGVELQDYEDPQAATQAILYGLVADGISNIGQPIENLANIQDEVGWPTTAPTEGMEYALLTYGIDGWGKEMRLKQGRAVGEEEFEAFRYTVTSAGADGAFDTDDDLSLTVPQSDDYSWDQNRVAFFVRLDTENDPMLFIHRWTGENFEYANQSKAQELTGDLLFDVLLDLDATWADPLRAHYDTATAKGQGELALLVY